MVCSVSLLNLHPKQRKNKKSSIEDMKIDTTNEAIALFVDYAVDMTHMVKLTYLSLPSTLSSVV